MTAANVHDLQYLKDVQWEYSDCTILGDKGYLSAPVQLDLFETANITLDVPYRLNQKNWTLTHGPINASERESRRYSLY